MSKEKSRPLNQGIKGQIADAIFMALFEQAYRDFEAKVATTAQEYIKSKVDIDALYEMGRNIAAAGSKIWGDSAIAGEDSVLKEQNGCTIIAFPAEQYWADKRFGFEYPTNFDIRGYKCMTALSSAVLSVAQGYQGAHTKKKHHFDVTMPLMNGWSNELYIRDKNWEKKFQALTRENQQLNEDFQKMASTLRSIFDSCKTVAQFEAAAPMFKDYIPVEAPKEHPLMLVVDTSDINKLLRKYRKDDAPNA